MSVVPEDFQDLLRDETRAFVYIATIMRDGTPQVTPVWFNADEKYILINSAAGRVKDINMRQRPHVALVIADPANPYRYLQVRGRVVEITEEGADAHIDTLAYKYLGAASYPYRNDRERRVIYKILPEHLDTH